jgi:hypothetical protein
MFGRALCCKEQDQLIGVMSGKSPMNNFLIDFSFQSNSMGPKFSQFIQRYAI